jgi:hypothetical protein
MSTCLVLFGLVQLVTLLWFACSPQTMPDGLCLSSLCLLPLWVLGVSVGVVKAWSSAPAAPEPCDRANPA